MVHMVTHMDRVRVRMGWGGVAAWQLQMKQEPCHQMVSKMGSVGRAATLLNCTLHNRALLQAWHLLARTTHPHMAIMVGGWSMQCWVQLGVAVCFLEVVPVVQAVMLPAGAIPLTALALVAHTHVAAVVVVAAAVDSVVALVGQALVAMEALAMGRMMGNGTGVVVAVVGGAVGVL